MPSGNINTCTVQIPSLLLYSQLFSSGTLKTHVDSINKILTFIPYKRKVVPFAFVIYGLGTGVLVESVGFEPTVFVSLIYSQVLSAAQARLLNLFTYTTVSSFWKSDMNLMTKIKVVLYLAERIGFEPMWVLPRNFSKVVLLPIQPPFRSSL